jgi:hypothetical protein
MLNAERLTLNAKTVLNRAVVFECVMPSAFCVLRSAFCVPRSAFSVLRFAFRVLRSALLTTC